RPVRIQDGYSGLYRFYRKDGCRRASIGSGSRAAEAPKIERSASFRARARQALPAEWLRAHHRTDLVAIDVDIARLDAVDNVLHPRVDPRVKPEGKPVTFCIDGGNHLVDLLRLEC